MKFETWMKKANEMLIKDFEVGADDLPDYFWRDAFEIGMSPREAVNEFKNEMLYDI